MLSLLRHCCKPYITLVVNNNVLWDCIYCYVVVTYNTGYMKECALIQSRNLVLSCMTIICCREVSAYVGENSSSHASLSAGENYWTKGHVLSEQIGCCPEFFPKELSPTVFTAGKSLCLLKLCNPKVGVADCIRCRHGFVGCVAESVVQCGAPSYSHSPYINQF